MGMDKSILVVDGLSFQYDDSGYALKDVSFSITKGEWLAIVGHNGSGKSTLAKILNGLLLPQRGTVSVGSTLLTEDSIWEI